MRLILAPLLAVALAAPAMARAETTPVALPEVTTWKLDNGLTVAHVPLRRAPVVAVQIWYHAGAKDEPADKRGLVRLFERLMFHGSQRVRPGQHAEGVERVGGYVSAESSEDAIWFTSVLPSLHLDYALELEADRMRGLLIRESVVAAERELASQRATQELYDPVQAGLRRFLQVAYQKHPYRIPAAGNPADLARVTADDVRRFYDAYFQPNNALLVIAGNVSAADARAAVERRFGAIARGPEAPRPSRELVETAQSAMRKQTVGAGQVGLVIGGFHIPEARHPDIYALQLMSLILGSGHQAGLRQALGGGKLASDTGSQALVWEEPGIFAVLASYEEAGRGEAIATALLAASKALHAGPDAAALARAKDQLIAAFAYGTEEVGQLAEQVGTSWILTDDPGHFVRDVAEFQKLTVEDLARVAKTYLIDKNFTVIISPPASGAEGGTR